MLFSFLEWGFSTSGVAYVQEFLSASCFPRGYELKGFPVPIRRLVVKAQVFHIFPPFMSADNYDRYAVVVIWLLACKTLVRALY
jgi:hypothetical protein